MGIVAARVGRGDLHPLLPRRDRASLSLSLPAVARW